MSTRKLRFVIALVVAAVVAIGFIAALLQATV